MRRPILFFLSMLLLFSIPLLFIGLIQFSRTQITPNDQFFELQKGGIPDIKKENWTLEIEGKVDNPIRFDYDNFTSLESIKLTATLECVDGPSGTAEWEGIPLVDILGIAGIRDDAYDIVFYAEDDYSDSLNMEEASEENIILAFKMNRETLPKEQGFPVRLVCPDHYGYKWVKWIVKIKVVDYDHLGYWEKRGWSDNASRTNFSNWIIHAYLFSIAFIFGGLSIISGYKFSQKPNRFKELPQFVSIRFHIIFSILFVIFSCISFIYWSISTIISRGALFYSLHGIIGLITIVLLIIGSILGLPKYRKTKKGRIYHRKISSWAFSLFLISILFGLLIAVVGSFRLNQIFSI